MREARIYNHEPFAEPELVVTLRYDWEHGLTAEGDLDQARSVRGIAVLDPERQLRLTSESDPDRWLYYLPTAFRTPYTSVQVSGYPEDRPPAPVEAGKALRQATVTELGHAAGRLVDRVADSDMPTFITRRGEFVAALVPIAMATRMYGARPATQKEFDEHFGDLPTGPA